MEKLFKKIKNILNKDVTSFLDKYKIPLVGILVVVLLACIGVVVTFAFYQVSDTKPIIGGSTADISDLDIRVMAEERDANGNGLNSYSLYPYIPKAGYEYNSTKSYCTNGSTINYDASKFDADITSDGHDVCYLYFDSTAQLDITLNVYAENVDSDGEGNGEYTKLDTTTLPSIGYEIDTTQSSCTNGSTVTYDVSENLFSVDADGKDVCNVYMKAMDVDIALKIYIQAKKNSTLYYEATSIPKTSFYSLNSEKSACTGTSTMSIKNQKVIIGATGRTNCVAYLDVTSGPMLESMKVSGGDTSVTINLTNSSLGTTPSTYYYSKDGGSTYVSSTNSSYTFTNLSNPANEFMAYSLDSTGKSSRVMATSTYSYYGLVDYSNQNQTRTIAEPGYYKLEVWGASGGGSSSVSTRGYGGYSVGTLYLDANETIYINIGGAGNTVTSAVSTVAGGYNGGGQAYSTDSYGTNNYGSGGGATHIATKSGVLSSLANYLDNIIIVAGGGGGSAYYYNTTVNYHYGSGGSGGGANGADNYNGYTSTTTLGTAKGGAQTLITSTDTNTISGAFGKGADAKEGYAGGGGGYYGGQSRYLTGGAGGSGYIGNTNLTNKIMYCYNCTVNNNDSTKTQTTTCHSASATEKCAKEGNGFATITYVGKTLE